MSGRARRRSRERKVDRLWLHRLIRFAAAMRSAVLYGRESLRAADPLREFTTAERNGQEALDFVGLRFRLDAQVTVPDPFPRSVMRIS